jgi:hypothetical protein
VGEGLGYQRFISSEFLSLSHLLSGLPLVKAILSSDKPSSPGRGGML